MLLSHCHYQSLATRAGLDFAALDSPEEYLRFIEDGPLLNNPWGIPEFIRRHSLPKVLLEYELIRHRCCSDDTILITRDMFDLGARISTEKLGVRVLWVFAAPSQVTTWRIRIELFGDVLASDINRLRAKGGLPPVSHWASWLKYPHRSLALWPDWFAPPDPTWPAGVVPVGFMVDDEAETEEVPDEVKAILEDDEPPILITGGTGMYLGTEFYAAGAEACRLLNRRGILVTQHEEKVPRFLPNSVQRFSYLPFRKLMPHVGAVIHHGGMGTLSGAMAAGIPQLVLAMGADRPDNASRLRRLGVAEYLPPPAWQPTTVAETLRQLTSSQAVRERCRDLARQLRENDAVVTACEVIEGVIQNRDSLSDRAPAPMAAAYSGIPAQNEQHGRKTNDSPELPGHLSPERLELLARFLSKNSDAALGLLPGGATSSDPLTAHPSRGRNLDE